MPLTRAPGRWPDLTDTDQASALTYAGLATDEHGHPDNRPKMLQFVQVKAWKLPQDHDQRCAVEAGESQQLGQILNAQADDAQDASEPAWASLIGWANPISGPRMACRTFSCGV